MASETDTRDRRSGGDLFEHYGVELDRGRGSPGPIVDGRPCSGCGWLLRADAGPTCPACGRPDDGSTAGS